MTQVKIEGFVPTAQSKEDMVKLSFKLHSIILLVGPDCSGKTRFVMEQLMPQLKMAQTGQKRISISHLDIDQISKELLDNPFALKTEREFIQIEEQAKDILFNKVKNCAAYPVNTDFIIVDTIGLDSDFRAEILKLGEENHYHVSVLVFDFDDKKEYSDIEGGIRREASLKQLKDLRRVLSGGMSKKDYESIQTIVSKKFFQYEITIEDYSAYDQFILPDGPEYVIIGDIHGCLDEFISLLKLNGFEIGVDQKITHPEGKRVVLIGDLIDKGYNIKGVIDFVYTNLDMFYMVIGNHENFVYKVLKGILKKGEIATSEVREEFFNSIGLLEEIQPPRKPQEPGKNSNAILELKYSKDMQEYEQLMREFIPLTIEESAQRKETREKFFIIFESMKAFFVHKDFVVTHAPTERKYLGKISSDGLRAARDFRYPKRRDFKMFFEFILEFDERVKFLKSEASDLHPFHVFGHVMTKEHSRFKNKIAIDTGCVAGGKLTSAIIKNNRIFTKSVSVIDESKFHKAELYNFFEQVRDGNIADS